MTLEVKKIEVKQEETRVYNLSVADTHTYFVTDLQVFTHNTSCNPKGVGSITINNPVLENIRTGSALKKDAQHAFNDVIDNYASQAERFDLVGGDGVRRDLYQIEGSLNGKKGGSSDC